MAFFLLFFCGVLGGIRGGMGMGGGSALIPLLTLCLGVEQTAAQGVNLLAFLPMAALALSVHKRGGLVQKNGLFRLIVPALLSAALSSLLASFLPAAALRKGFGAFLIFLSFLTLREAIFSRGKKSL